MMKKRDTSAITLKITQLKVRLDKLYEENREVIRATPIQCGSCKKSGQCSEWVFIRWYSTSPINDNDPEYYDTLYCDIVCPRCSAQNYIAHHKQVERIMKFFDHGVSPREIFKSVETKKKV